MFLQVLRSAKNEQFLLSVLQAAEQKPQASSFALRLCLFFTEVRHMRKEEFFYESYGCSAQIHAVRWIPDKKPRCVVQIIHGMAEYAERYEHFAGFLAEQGILVTAHDHLGHGKSLYGKNREDIGHPLGYFCSQDPATAALEDIQQLRKITRQEYPDLPYIMLGHSMGSFMLRNYLCSYGADLNGAIVMGTGMLPLALVKCAKMIAAVLKVCKGEQHPSRLLNAMSFGAYNKQIKDPVTSMDWLSTDSVQVQKYVEDRLCGFCFTVNGFQTLFELLARLHDGAWLEKMPRKLPVLFVAGGEDPVGDFGKAVQSVADRFSDMGMEHVTCKLYPGMRHEILNEKDRDQVENDLLCWIEKQLSAGN